MCDSEEKRHRNSQNGKEEVERRTKEWRNK